MEEIRLVQSARAGDRGAFSALVARHRHTVYAQCYRLTGNADDAEDLAHEAFVEAFTRLNQLRDPARFGAWLRAIVLNLFRMAVRRKVPAPAELTEEMPAAEAPAENLLTGRLSHGLSQLSYPHRLALVLHYLEGLTYEEVAAFLDVPIGTVMSRLHRGRKELKRLVVQMTEEEIPMMPEDAFTREVEAEITVLLELSRGDKEAAERLSVLLVRSPERLAGLIADPAVSNEVLENLALVLRRLGRPALEIVLASALTGDVAVRSRATYLLQQFIAHLRRQLPGGPALTRTAPFELYLLLDALIRVVADEGDKAELIVVLLESSEDAPGNTLLINLLLSFPDAALPRLLDRFWRVEGPDGLYERVAVLISLARMGTRFVAVLLEPLTSGEARRQCLALAGMEAFARSYHSRSGEPDAQTLRHADKWAPIPPEHVDEMVVADAVARTAHLLDDPREEIRQRAIRVLGIMQAVVHRASLEALVHHKDPATRVAAIRSLADLGCSESAPVFVTVAREGTPAEQTAAAEALGRLQSSEALPVLEGLLASSDRQVRRAAVTALGDIGGEDARAVLQRLMQGSDRELARMAATTLHTSPHFTAKRKDNPALNELRKRVKAKTVGEEAQPCLFISLDAAITALPEIRAYSEREVTRHIARACIDYATTRRQLIMERLMRREHGVYALTETGEAMWRVEHFIREHYLR